MWKALSVIAAVLAAGAAFLSYLNKGDVEQEREQLATSVRNLADITARNQEVVDAQAVILRRNKAMENRREEALAEQEAEKGKLDDKTQEVEDTNVRIKELETEIAEAKEDIAEFGNIEQLVTLIDQLQTDLFSAKNEIASLETSLSSTKTQEQITAERIQAIKDLEFRQRNGQMVSINANIASVYPNWGFVILGAGDRQGVVSRTKLDVKRGGEKIAELVVTNLEKNRSICDIVPGSMQPGQMLRPGDRVTVSPDSLPKPRSEAPAKPATGGADLPEAAPTDTPAAEDPMDAFDLDPAPAPAPAPAEADDPFGDLDATPAPTEDPAPAEPEAPAGDDPFSDL